MSDYMELHNDAMMLTEQAAIERKRGNIDKAATLEAEAFEKEQMVALAGKDKAEPLRSILLRSAATLAYRCNKLEESARLIHLALSGNPPSDLKFELNELIQKISFDQHLSLRGITLSEKELQLSLAGSQVAPGFIESECFIDRFKALKTLIHRTVARLSELPFSEGDPLDGLAHSYDVFMSVPRSQSYAITLRLGAPVGVPAQPSLPYSSFVNSDKVIDEVGDCIELFSKEDDIGLAKRIPDPAYYRSFVGLAKRISPDEKKVNTVGITVLHDGEERRIAIQKPGSKVEISMDIELVGTNQKRKKRTRETVEIIGFLKQADSVAKTNTIRIQDEDSGETTKILVPQGMMDDIVRPRWNTRVKVLGVKCGKNITLKDIDSA